SGATTSLSSIFATFRHLFPWRKRSQSATGTPRPASPAAIFEPMKPAPPVTRIISSAHFGDVTRRQVYAHGGETVTFAPRRRLAPADVRQVGSRVGSAAAAH